MNLSLSVSSSGVVWCSPGSSSQRYRPGPLLLVVGRAVSSLSWVSLLVVIVLSLCDIVDSSSCCPLSCRSMVTDNELVVVQHHGNGGEGYFDSHGLLLVLVVGACRPISFER